MKVCFPIEVDQGLDSGVSPHFGHVPGYIIVDSETMEFRTVGNAAGGHGGGGCAPVGLLGREGMEALVVGGIGQGAVMKLMQLGTRIYRAEPGTVRENMQLLASGGLVEITGQATCEGHGHHGGGGCGHGSGRR